MMAVAKVTVAGATVAMERVLMLVAVMTLAGNAAVLDVVRSWF